MKSFSSAILTAVIFCFLFLPPFAVAKEENVPSIADILITTSQTHLLLFCSIKDSFTPEMIEGVQSGIPVSFSFLIELEKIVNNWPDSTLVDMTIQHTLSFDPLKEKYQITFSGKQDNAVTTDSLEKAIETMSDLNGTKILSLEELEPDEPYALHVKATLAEKTLPMNMHYLVPFISLWNFETDWRTIEFRY